MCCHFKAFLPAPLKKQIREAKIARYKQVTPSGGFIPGGK